MGSALMDSRNSRASPWVMRLRRNPIGCYFALHRPTDAAQLLREGRIWLEGPRLCNRCARLESTRQPRPTSQRQELALAAVMIDVIVNSPAFGIGLHAPLQLENAVRRLPRGAWRGGKRFLLGEALQPCFQGESLRRRSRLERRRLLV